jgi:hypothetical protein
MASYLGAPGSILCHVVFVVDKMALGQVFSKYFFDNVHFTDCSILFIRGWYKRPNSDRRTKWTQSHPIPRIKMWKGELIPKDGFLHSGF